MQSREGREKGMATWQRRKATRREKAKMMMIGPAYIFTFVPQ